MLTKVMGLELAPFKVKRLFPVNLDSALDVDC